MGGGGGAGGPSAAHLWVLGRSRVRGADGDEGGCADRAARCGWQCAHRAATALIPASGATHTPRVADVPLADKRTAWWLASTDV